jgi:ABC-2 type transport system ATP-binding protein
VATGDGEAAISLQDVTQDYGTARALDGLTLTVPLRSPGSEGSIFGFLGPNGAGKTTTIRVLLGLQAPTSGRARVLGYDTRTQGDEIRARTGALLEHSGL